MPPPPRAARRPRRAGRAARAARSRSTAGTGTASPRAAPGARLGLARQRDLSHPSAAARLARHVAGPVVDGRGSVGSCPVGGRVEREDEEAVRRVAPVLDGARGESAAEQFGDDAERVALMAAERARARRRRRSRPDRARAGPARRPPPAPRAARRARPRPAACPRRARPSRSRRAPAPRRCAGSAQASGFVPSARMPVPGGATAGSALQSAWPDEAGGGDRLDPLADAADVAGSGRRSRRRRRVRSRAAPRSRRRAARRAGPTPAAVDARHGAALEHDLRLRRRAAPRRARRTRRTRQAQHPVRVVSREVGIDERLRDGVRHASASVPVAARIAVARAISRLGGGGDRRPRECGENG